MLKSAQKLIHGQASFLKLKTGLCRKETLPDYDFDSLGVLWTYKPTHCVRDLFSRKSETDIDFSICIPAFNVEKSILTLLEQIEKQNTKFKIEVIIVNDVSTDKTGELVERFIAGRENYHLFEQDKKAELCRKGLSVNPSASTITRVI